MLIKRDRYLRQLIGKQWNGRIKILTGIRRCGKSTVLFEIFLQYLLNQKMDRGHIITLALDDDKNKQYRNPEELSKYIRSKCVHPEEKYYVLLDEIQYAISKEELHNPDTPVRLYSVLNGLLHMKNIDVYVTGSNSKLLSRDVSTEFRGRGDTIHIYPLSFTEYYEASGMDKEDAYAEYAMYGGMPYLLNLNTDDEKYDYLDNLFEEIYFKDIEERYAIRLPGVLRDLTSSLCSSVGSLTNASKIAKAVNSMKNVKTDSETISQYLSYLADSFLFSKAERYDVKGKRYFEYPAKFYCTDIGLRNVRLGLRQQEPTHIMENILYNELLVRGYAVDVGVVEAVDKNAEGRRTQKSLEIDFIARKGSKKYYIQSAFSMEDVEKQKMELRPLLAVEDFFKKIVVSKTYGKSWTDDRGILRIGLLDFLMDENSLDR
jgi:predicted AAA+ superfamily ATPase